MCHSLENGWQITKMKPYYQDEWVIIYHGDCREILPELPKVDLVLTDPPYNIHKADWDRIPDYINWSGLWLKQVEGLLADNGSFYFFHNEMPTIAELMCWIKVNTKFIFKQFIVWNKRFDESGNKGFLDGFVETGGLRNFQQMAEYILFYTLQDKFIDNRLYFNAVKEIQHYIKTLIYKYGGNVTKANEFYCKLSGKTGVYRSLFFGKSQSVLYTKEQYNGLCEYIKSLGCIELLKDYAEILNMVNRKKYDSLRYTFNNQGTHHSVWNYETAERIDHATPKPVDLIQNIITHSSNEGNLILDPFLGSGTTAYCAKKLNRKCIGIEIEEKYCEIAAKRCSQSVMRLDI